MSSSVHVDNKERDILILGEGPTQGFDDTGLTAEKRYSINFTVYRKKFCLSLHYNGVNSYLFVQKLLNSKQMFPRPLCLGNISKDFPTDNMKKTGF